MQFKIGDIVTPKSLAELGLAPNELPRYWVADMKNYIGKEGEVRDITKDGRFRVDFADDYWYYYSHQLKKAGSKVEKPKRELKFSDLKVGMKVRIKTDREFLETGWEVRHTHARKWFYKMTSEYFIDDMLATIGKVVTIEDVVPYSERFTVEGYGDSWAWDIDMVAEIISEPQVIERETKYVDTKTAMKALQEGRYNLAIPKCNKAVGMWLNADGEPKKATYNFGINHKQDDFIMYPEYVIDDQWKLIVDRQLRDVTLEAVHSLKSIARVLYGCGKITQADMDTIMSIAQKVK